MLSVGVDIHLVDSLPSFTLLGGLPGSVVESAADEVKVLPVARLFVCETWGVGVVVVVVVVVVEPPLPVYGIEAAPCCQTRT